MLANPKTAVRKESAESPVIAGTSATTTYSETWPSRPESFPELMTVLEAAQYLRLDELGTHTPQTAARTLNFWRDKGDLKATKFARRVWFRKAELDRFLINKTEE